MRLPLPAASGPSESSVNRESLSGERDYDNTPKSQANQKTMKARPAGSTVRLYDMFVADPPSTTTSKAVGLEILSN